MPLLILFVVLAVLATIALVAAGRGDPLPDPAPNRAPLRLAEGEIAPDDLEHLRFGVGFRGYRMDQVDEVLDRLAVELADRDARIAQLEAAPSEPRPADSAEG